MMTSRQMLGLSFILLLVGLPLISFAAGDFVGWLGFLLIIAGAALPPVAKLAGLVEEPKEKEEDD